MSTRLIIDGNAVYEIDEECLACRGRRGSCRPCIELHGGAPRPAAPASIHTRKPSDIKPPSHK